MSKYTLIEGLYLYITPVGAYYAVTAKEEDKSRKFLKNLLLEAQTPVLDIESLKRLMGEDNDDKVLELLRHCQNIGWVQGVNEVILAPEGALDELLPKMLMNISEIGKILLADDQGFYLACDGFPHEVAEELSALSAEIENVHRRRSGLLVNNLGLASQAWAIVDAFGGSQIGFWPVFIGETRFVIVISGIPHFNQTDFVSLVWALSRRYAV